MNNNRELIQHTLNIRHALEFYGLRFNRSGFASCPFHNERTASFSTKGAFFHCFGCGVSGDIVTFVRRMFDLSTQEAIVKINADFGLGLPFCKNSKPSERLAAAKQIGLLRKQFAASEQKLNQLQNAVDEAESGYISAWRITQDEAHNGSQTVSQACAVALHLLPMLERKYNIAQAKLNQYLIERS